MGQAQLPFQDVLNKLEEAGVYPRWYDSNAKEISFEKVTKEDIKVIEDLGGTFVRNGSYTAVYKFE